MKKFVLFLCCLLLLTGCTYQKEIDVLQSQIDDLQNEIDSLKQQLNEKDSSVTPDTEESQTEAPSAPVEFSRYKTTYGDLIQYQGAPMLEAEEMVKLVKSSAVAIKVISSGGFNLNCGGTVLLHNQNTTLILISAYSIQQFDQIFVVLQENEKTIELPAMVLNYNQEVNVAILQVEGEIGTPVAFGTSNSVQLGQYIVNCSYDENFSPVVCSGSVLSITDEIYSILPEIGKIRGTAVFSQDGYVIGFYLNTSSIITPIDSVIQAISDLLNS